MRSAISRRPDSWLISGRSARRTARSCRPIRRGRRRGRSRARRRPSATRRTTPCRAVRRRPGGWSQPTGIPSRASPPDEAKTCGWHFATSSGRPAVSSAPHAVSRMAVGHAGSRPSCRSRALTNIRPARDLPGIHEEEPRRGEESVDGRAAEIAEVIEIRQERPGRPVQEVGAVDPVSGRSVSMSRMPASSSDSHRVRQTRTLGGPVRARMAGQDEVGDRQATAADRARRGSGRASPRYRGDR